MQNLYLYAILGILLVLIIIVVKIIQRIRANFDKRSGRKRISNSRHFLMYSKKIDLVIHNRSGNQLNNFPNENEVDELKSFLKMEE